MVSAVLYGAVVLVLVSGFRGAPVYPVSGSASAAHALEARLRPGDVVLVMPVSAFPLAVESDVSTRILSDSASVTGLRVAFDDKRFTEVFLNRDVAPSEVVHARVCDADRVLEFRAFVAVKKQRQDLVAEILRDAGFKRTGGRALYGHAAVLEWRRGDAVAADSC